MDSRWFKSSSNREERKKEILSFQGAFEELDKLLVESFKKKEADYEYGPEWAYRQIAINEYNRVLEDVRKLIKF